MFYFILKSAIILLRFIKCHGMFICIYLLIMHACTGVVLALGQGQASCVCSHFTARSLGSIVGVSPVLGCNRQLACICFEIAYAKNRKKQTFRDQVMRQNFSMVINEKSLFNNYFNSDFDDFLQLHSLTIYEYNE